MSDSAVPARRAVLALPLLIVVACTTSDSGAAVADTVAIDPRAAGVPVVTIDQSTPSTWSYGGLQEEPEDELDLAGVAGVVALSGDRYFLAEGTRVRLFDREARELWRTGQPGAGPSDFQGLGWPCRLRGDTVVVMDQSNRRIAYVVAGVGVVASVPTPGANLREGACFGDGTFVTFRMVPDTTTDAGEFVVELRSAADREPVVVHRAPSSLGLMVGRGELWAGVVDTLIFVSDPNRGTITLLDRAGSFVRELRWAAPRDPVTDENIPDRFGMVPAGATAAELDAWWDRVRGRKRMEYWPAFAQVQADADGRLWIVERFDQPKGARQYLVVSQAGEVVAKVQLPWDRNRYIFLVGFVKGGIVVRHDDEDGAPHFRVIPYPDPLRP